MNHIWKEIQLTRDEGQKEYAHTDDNVFANFDRVGSLLNIGSECTLMVYLLKHIDGITAHLKGHKSQREDVRGRIKDAIVYLMLLWAMIEEKESNGKKI
jgi:hypothetical protein|tara:strand:+ start:1446 stop:1742 length:297 start_codon:yes stop_codon:yes gene_type:complete